MLFRPSLRTTGAIAAAGLSALLSSSAALAAAKWDMPLVWPDTNYHVQNAKVFVERVKKATNGSVDITIHSGGALGIKGPETLVAVRDGVVKIAEFDWQTAGGEDPFVNLFTVPFLAVTYDEGKVLLSVARPSFDKIAAKYNQKILYMVPWPGQGAYTKKPVVTLADLSGVKIRTGVPIATKLYQRLGASAVQMPWAEVVPGLASGVIEAVATSSTSGVDGKFWEFMGHFNRFNWALPINVVTVNLEAWNKLTAGERTTIEKTAREAEPEFWKVAVAEDEKNLKILADRGMKVSQPSAALNSELVKAAQPLWEDFISLSKFIPAREVINQYRAKVGK
ncbi:MAG: TRAP transporter substrate-binding protein [Proteobacteria bacterium]|nr:TRAP transporter substrate-binding protein [Pseudomonadota bacterium]